MCTSFFFCFIYLNKFPKNFVLPLNARSKWELYRDHSRNHNTQTSRRKKKKRSTEWEEQAVEGENGSALGNRGVGIVSLQTVKKEEKKQKRGEKGKPANGEVRRVLGIQQNKREQLFPQRSFSYATASGRSYACWERWEKDGGDATAPPSLITKMSESGRYFIFANNCYFFL